MNRRCTQRYLLLWIAVAGVGLQSAPTFGGPPGSALFKLFKRPTVRTTPPALKATPSIQHSLKPKSSPTSGIRGGLASGAHTFQSGLKHDVTSSTDESNKRVQPQTPANSTHAVSYLGVLAGTLVLFMVFVAHYRKRTSVLERLNAEVLPQIKKFNPLNLLKTNRHG